MMPNPKRSKHALGFLTKSDEMLKHTGKSTKPNEQQKTFRSADHYGISQPWPTVDLRCRLSQTIVSFFVWAEFKPSISLGCINRNRHIKIVLDGCVHSIQTLEKYQTAGYLVIWKTRCRSFSPRRRLSTYRFSQPSNLISKHSGLSSQMEMLD